MELLVLAFLILLNGLFSMAEMAVATSRPARLQQRVNSGVRGAAAALRLHEAPATFLSTVQVGITSIGILSGAFGEDAIVAHVERWLQTWPLAANHAEGIAIAVMVLVIAYFSVVFGEIVPKRLAMMAPERVAILVSGPMTLMSRTMKPLVWLFSHSSDLLLRLIGAGDAPRPPVTVDELRSLLAEGTAAGVFDSHEEAMIGNVLGLDTLRVAHIMTPRVDVEYLDLDHRTQAIELLRRGEHSTLPLCRGKLDNVIGMIEAKRLVGRLLDDTFDLEAVVEPAVYVPEGISPMQLLDALRKRGRRTALVVDEYGSVEGLVTLSDVTAAIIAGTTVDTLEPGSIVRRADGSWLVDGGMRLAELAQALAAPELQPDESRGYQTLAGLVLHALGRIPRVGESVRYGDWQLEVVDMDGHKIDRLLLQRDPREESPDDG